MVAPLGRRSLLALLAGGLAGVAQPALAALFPASGRWDFVAESAAGERLGQQSYRFSRTPGHFFVRLDADYALPQGPRGEPPSRFLIHSEETWIDGWLSGVVTDARLGDRRWRLRAEREGNRLAGFRDGRAFTASGYLIPSSLWHPDTPLVEAVFDILDGRLRAVRGYRLGSERLVVAGSSTTAAHWQLVGELPMDLWYDEERRLVRALLPRGSGAAVTLRR